MIGVLAIAGFAIGRLQVRMSAWATAHQGLLSLPSLRVGKWVPAAAGKAKAGIAHTACGWNAGCAGKTVISLPLTMRAIPERLRDTSCGGAIKIVYLYLLTLMTLVGPGWPTSVHRFQCTCTWA